MAAAHGRIEVPKLHGRLSAMTFSTPEDARTKEDALHLLETEILQKYDQLLGNKNHQTISKEGHLVTNDISGTYLFWILTANYVARNDESFRLKYSNLSSWLTIKRDEAYLSLILKSNEKGDNHEMNALRARFTKTLEHSNSTKLNSFSSLEYKRSSKHEAAMHNVLEKLTHGASVLNVNVLSALNEGEVKLDKDTESWMKNELTSGTGSETRSTAGARTASRRGSAPPSLHSINEPDEYNKTNQQQQQQKPSHDLLGIRLPSGGNDIFDSLIDRIGTWELDILGEYEHLQKRPLFYVCLAATQRDGLLDAFAKIVPDDNVLLSLSTAEESAPIKKKFTNFLMALENKYISTNTYHNNCHAADVVNSMVCLLSDGKSELEMTVLQRMVSVVAAAAHDVAHTGQNNGFHNKYVTKYAVEYSDQSTMEMLHLATTFKILQKEDCNIFGHMCRDDYSMCRKLMIEMILATDLSKHFDLLNNYSIELDKDGIVSSNKLLEIVLKAADIGHAVKSIPIHQKWSMAVSK